MTTAATAPGRRFRFIGYFLWVLPLVGVSVMVALDPAKRSVTPVFHLAAERWWAGGELYADVRGYHYLPQFALLFAPFHALPVPVGDILWRAISVAPRAVGDRGLRAPHAAGRHRARLLLRVPARARALPRGRAQRPDESRVRRAVPARRVFSRPVAVEVGGRVPRRARRRQAARSRADPAGAVGLPAAAPAPADRPRDPRGGPVSLRRPDVRGGPVPRGVGARRGVVGNDGASLCGSDRPAADGRPPARGSDGAAAARGSPPSPRSGCGSSRARAGGSRGARSPSSCFRRST